MPRPPALLSALAAVLSGALLAGCDAAPGLPAPEARPAVTALALSPAGDSLETDAPALDLPLVATVDVAGAGPMIVRAVVRYAETDSLVAEAEVAVPGAGRVAVPLPARLPRGATGDYVVEVATEGPDRRLGDGASALFRFRAANLGPPVVLGVDAPAGVARPASATSAPTRLPVVARVTDPDGRVNVAAVFLLDAATGGVVARLYDEGTQGRGQGDRAARDGLFTQTLTVPFGVEPGTVALEVVALDRAGAVSAAFPLAVEIR